jgi:glycosyltransferase involved in cell wall biosynthesis
LEFVEEEVRPFYPGGWTPLASIRVYHYLRARDGAFDIVHFPENSGIGYFSTLAKFEGLILRDASIVVGLHGAEVEWAAMLGKRYPSEQYAVNQGFFERRSAELADVVISPSEYMLEYVRLRGWKLPPSTYVIPNIVSTSELHPTSLDPDPPATNSSLITEIVFFGRLEERKGVRLFVEALELLFAVDSPYPIGDVNKITFLGRDTINDASRTDTSKLVESAVDALLAHSKVAFEYQFLKEYERDDAISYLQHPNRLAVLPSLSDNSPSTVLECIVYSIRFLATNVGGVPELVHEGDRGRVLFPPLPRDFAAKLSETIVDDSTVSKPIRRAAATSTAQDDWVGLHGWIASLPAPPLPPSLAPLVSIVVTHYERPRLIPHLLDSLLAQTYTNYEVILVDDGSTSQAAVFALLQLQQKYFAPSPDWRLLRINNSYLGEARNRGAALGRGSYFLFLDDDDVLKPHALQTLVDVVSRTGASALSTWLDEFAGDMDPRTAVHPLPHRRSYWFLGQSVTSGMVSNTFGSGNIFVSRNAFEGIGGFTTYREVGGEDWEFYMRLALAGHSQYVVPEELIHVRSDPAGSSMVGPVLLAFRSIVLTTNDRNSRWILGTPRSTPSSPSSATVACKNSTSRTA